jgi:tetratricopeptide (TPR) repeat protein
MKIKAAGTLVVWLACAACFAQQATTADRARDNAYALEQQGQFADAETAWRAIAVAHPTDAEANAHLGFLEARQEHYRQAIPYYRKALELNPSMPGLRLNLGLSEFKSGAMRAAVATFTPLLKSEPEGSADALRVITLIGLAHYGAGDYAEAVPFLKKATAADPQNLPFRLTLAQACLWSKQYQCVLDVYREIVTLNAESAEADMLAGEALDEMKDKAGAAQQFRAAVKADPKMPEAHFGLGYLLWGLMQFDEAAKEFEAELANNPSHAESMAYLADCDIQLGHPDAAAPLLQKSVGINAKIELAHIDLGILAGDANRKDDALRELKIAERLNPSDQNVHWRLARLYQSEGRKVEAKAEFDKTRSLQKASDESVFNKLHQAQDKGAPSADPPPAPSAQ